MAKGIVGENLKLVMKNFGYLGIVLSHCLLSACSENDFSKDLEATQTAERPPNVIIIFSDDQGYADLGVQGVIDDINSGLNQGGISNI